jgi:hypothetical protein
MTLGIKNKNRGQASAVDASINWRESLQRVGALKRCMDYRLINIRFAPTHYGRWDYITGYTVSRNQEPFI